MESKKPNKYLTSLAALGGGLLGAKLLVKPSIKLGAKTLIKALPKDSHPVEKLVAGSIGGAIGLGTGVVGGSLVGGIPSGIAAHKLQNYISRNNMNRHLEKIAGIKEYAKVLSSAREQAYLGVATRKYQKILADNLIKTNPSRASTLKNEANKAYLKSRKASHATNNARKHLAINTGASATAGGVGYLAGREKKAYSFEENTYTHRLPERDGTLKMNSQEYIDLIDRAHAATPIPKGRTLLGAGVGAGVGSLVGNLLFNSNIPGTVLGGVIGSAIGAATPYGNDAKENLHSLALDMHDMSRES